MKVDNYTLSPGSFCFVRRIKRHLIKYGGRQLSDEALLAYLCELRCTEDDILKMIADGYMFSKAEGRMSSKAEGRMSSNDEGRMSSDILQKIDFELSKLQCYGGGFQKRKRRNEYVWYLVD